MITRIPHYQRHQDWWCTFCWHSCSDSQPVEPEIGHFDMRMGESVKKDENVGAEWQEIRMFHKKIILKLIPTCIVATISPGSLQTNTQESPADIWILIIIHHHHHHHHHQPHHHHQEHHQDQHHLHQHTWDRDEVPAVIGKRESSDELWVASHGGHAFSSVVIVDGLMGRRVLVNNWEKLSFEEENDSGAFKT